MKEDKETIILLHGALGNKKQLAALKRELKDGFRVYDLDFEGHSKKQSTKIFSMDQFVLDVLNFMQENSLPKTHIFGYSMGGYVALFLALRFPEKVEKIYTLGTKFDWNPETAAKELKKLNPELIQEKVPEYAANLQLHFGKDYWKDVLYKTADMMYQLGNGLALSSPDLQKINHNITIGIGEKDNMVGLEESQNAANLLPHGKLNVFKGFEHPIDKIDASTLAEAIKKFI